MASVRTCDRAGSSLRSERARARAVIELSWTMPHFPVVSHVLETNGWSHTENLRRLVLGKKDSFTTAPFASRVVPATTMLRGCSTGSGLFFFLLFMYRPFHGINKRRIIPRWVGTVPDISDSEFKVLASWLIVLQMYHGDVCVRNTCYHTSSRFRAEPSYRFLFRSTLIMVLHVWILRWEWFCLREKIHSLDKQWVRFSVFSTSLANVNEECNVEGLWPDRPWFALG